MFDNTQALHEGWDLFDVDGRWACPHCGSKDVEIALPLWCKEDTSHNLTPCHLDEEADPIYWLCNTCEASDKGSPVDLLRN